MAVAFSIDLKNLFKPASKSDLPDNGFELPGQNGDAILLIHGMTGTPHEMRFLANYLNQFLVNGNRKFINCIFNRK